MDKKEHFSLEDIGNDLPFRVPNNYFQDFALKMDSQITGKVVSIKKMIHSWMYLVAMFVGIFLIANVFFKFYQNRLQKTEQLEQYLLSQIDDVTILDSYLEEFEYYQ